MDERLPYPRPQRSSAEPWAALFLPKQYAKEHTGLTLKDYQLDEKRLRTLGVEVSKIRKALREKALRV
jgi:hypothetical protein